MHGERGYDWIGPKPHAGAVASPGLSLIQVFGNRKGGSFMVASIGREATIGQLAQLILALERSSPVRVAIDARTASGKTTFANELAAVVAHRNREVIRTSVDGFHRPKSERYVRGRYSPEGYYFDARDLDAIRALLLDPLGPGGDRRFRTVSFDLERDVPTEQTPLTASADSVLIVDGTFLQRPELVDGWDVTVFLQTSETVAERRGLRRDAERLGGVDIANRLYAERYRPAFALSGCVSLTSLPMLWWITMILSTHYSLCELADG
jgi:uridine kinase